ncbi:MAG: endolytic transglycosylase MltG, partial [Dehalococcoidia bacterium]
GLLFRVLAALEGVEGSLGAGEYQLQKGMPVAEVMQALQQAPAAPMLVTIPEGLRAEEIGAILEEERVVPAQEFMQAIALDYGDEFDFLADLPPAATLEGYLFPDTYDFPREATAEEVVREMLTNFDGLFRPELRREASAAGLTIHQVVTLASIVEREVVVGDERPIIAGVFLHRLELEMPLGADPTVQYTVANDPNSVAIYGYWKRELTVDDLAVDSPYNTRLNPGLPPGPIANPGLASLEAVVRPATTTYLYFVAKPDGSHAFAETEEEHLQNVQLYQGP